MKKYIIGIVLLLAISFTGLMVSEYKQESRQFEGIADFTTAVNNTRASYDLEPVINNAELEQIAMRKCKDMATRHYQSHVDPDGKKIWDYAPQGYKYGENLAGNYYNSYEVMQAWVKSPSHLENIVDPAFTQVGHAVCTDGKQYLVVQVFKSN